MTRKLIEVIKGNRVWVDHHPIAEDTEVIVRKRKKNVIIVVNNHDYDFSEVILVGPYELRKKVVNMLANAQKEVRER